MLWSISCIVRHFLKFSTQEGMDTAAKMQKGRKKERPTTPIKITSDYSEVAEKAGHDIRGKG